MSEALDNLGRKIDAGSMSIKELKGLVGTLMKSKVGPSKPISVFGEEKSKDSGDGNLKKLVDTFSKYVVGHQQEAEEQTGLIEKVKSLINEINNRKSGGQQEGKEEEKSPFITKALESLVKENKENNKEGKITADSTTGLYDVFRKRGSGYTHDIYCEKYLQQIYSILSQLAPKLGLSKESIVSVEDIKGSIKKESPTKAEAAVPKSEKEIDSNININQNQVETAIDDIRSYLDQQEPFSFNIQTARDTFDLIRSLITGSLSDKQVRNWAGAWGTQIGDISEHLRAQHEQVLSSMSSEEERVDYLRKVYDEAAKRADLAAAKAAGYAKKGDYWREEFKGLANSNQILAQQSALLRQQGVIQRRNNQLAKSQLDTLISVTDKIEKLIFGFDTLETVIGGTVRKEAEFTQQVRAAVFEIDGVTKSNRSLQKTYEDIEKTTYKTGVRRDKFQDAFIKGLKSGFKNQKKLNALVTSQLNTEKQIGVEAGSLGETFLEYGHVLKFNEDQVADIGRGFREVGRQTGIVGDKLKGVIEKSKQFVDDMRKAGTATSMSVKNITGLQAEFSKFGVDESGGRLLKALSGSVNLLQEADQKTKAFVLNVAQRAGMVDDAINGTILTNSKSLNRFGNALFQFTSEIGSNFGFVGNNAEELRNSLANIDPGNLTRLNLVLNNAFGMQANELISTIEAFENQSKTLADKLNELNKEKKKNLTLEERATLLEKERSLKLNASLSTLSSLSGITKNTSSMGEAFAKFSQQRENFEADMAALGQAWSSEKDVARASIQMALDNLNKGLKEAGKSEVQISTSEIEKALKDQSAFRDVVGQITKGEQVLATAQKAQLDPLTSMDQTLTEINDGIRDLSQSIISIGFNSLLGQIAIALAGFGAVALSGFTLAQKEIIDLGNALQFFFKARDATGDVAQSQGRGIIKALKEDFFDKATTKTKVSPITGERAISDKPSVASTVKDIVMPESSSGLLEINKAMLGVLNRIADCVCSGARQIKTETQGTQDVMTPVSKPAGATDVVAKAEKSAVKGAQSQEKKMSPVSKSIRRKMEKNIKTDESLNAAQKKTLVKNIRTGQKTDQIIKLEKEALKQEKRISLGKQKTEKIKTPKAAGFNIKEMISGGSEMAKTAAGVMVMAAGAVALGAAIVFLSNQILSSFDLDMKKIIETAGAVGALAIAGGAIAFAGMKAFEALTGDQKTKKFSSIGSIFKKEIMQQVAAIALLGPALVLLGATIVKLSQLIVGSFGLDMTTVANTAGTVAAIVGAAGALTYAASEALEGFERMSDSKLLKNPWEMTKVIAKGTVALLIIGPSLVLLSAAIVKFAQVVLGQFNLTAGEIATVAGRVAALIAGAGAIATAVIGAAAGLYGLGKLSEYAKQFKKEIYGGGKALLLFTPAILFLAAAVTQISRGILGVMGIDAATAAKTAYNVAGLIGSTALIAGAIIGAIAGLAGLGMLTNFAGAYVPIILGGAAALVILTPAIVLLSSALNAIVSGIMKVTGIDAATAAKTAYNVAGLIGSTALIAGAVIGAIAGLAGLGTLAAVAWSSAGLILIGAGALTVLTPAIVLLASALTSMVSGIMKESGVDANKAADTAKQVAKIIGSASVIALGVTGAIAGLAGLGTLAVGAVAFAPIMLAGAAALFVLTPAVMTLANSIIWMAKEISGALIAPEEIQKITDGVGSIIWGAAKISLYLIAAVGGLTALGAMSVALLAAIPLMWLGTKVFKWLISPLASFVGAVKEASSEIGKIISPSEAASMSEGISGVLKSVGEISKNIASSSASIVGFPKYSSWFNAIRGRTVADQMEMGVEVFKNLSNPIVEYVKSIKEFSASVAGIINPSEASVMAEDVANILASCAKITQNIATVGGEPLKQIVEAESFWSWLKGDSISGLMKNGASALRGLSAPIKDYVGAIVSFASGLGISPNKAAEMAVGVEAILCSIGGITKIILDTQQSLSSIPYGGWGWFKSKYVKQMETGVSSLTKISGPVLKYMDVIKKFSKKLGSKISPKKAAKMAVGVADIIGATGQVTENILSTRDKLSGIKEWSSSWNPFATNYVEASNEGVTALKKLTPPITNYVVAIKDFASELGSKINVSQSASMASGVTDVLVACGDVTDEILSTKDKLMTIKSSEGFWIFAKSLPAEMEKGINSLNELKEPIIKYVETISNFGESIKSRANPSESVKSVKVLTEMSNLLDGFSAILSNFKEKILPLTEGGNSWFTSSDIERIGAAKESLEEFFPKITEFVLSISTNVNSAFKESEGDLRSAVKNMGLMSQMFESLGVTTAVIKDKIVPLTNEGYLKSSDVDVISSSIGKFEGFFNGISNFITSGVVDPIKKIDESGIREATRKITVVAGLVEGASVSLESLNNISNLAESGWISKSPMQKINSNKKKFTEFFTGIGEFISEGLLEPVRKINIDGGIGELIQKTQLIGSFSKGVSDVILSMEQNVSLLDGGVVTSSPVKKIVNNKKAFAGHFESISEFLQSGIADPINAFDLDQLNSVGSKVKSIREILISIPEIISSLVTTVSLSTDSDTFFGEIPTKKIMDSKDKFKEHFISIADFLKEGIIFPVETVFKNVNFKESSSLMKSMSTIAASIMPIIENLGKVMNLMSGETGDRLDTEYKLDQIISKKKVFAQHFKNIAIFLRDGIITPVKDVFGDTKEISKARSIMSSLKSIISTVPQIILGISEGMLPLIQGGEDATKAIPMLAIENIKEEFAQKFKTISLFLKEGVLDPIMGTIEDSKSISKASSSLRRLNTVISTVSNIVLNVTKMLTAFRENSTGGIGEAEISQESRMFSNWFTNLMMFFSNLSGPLNNIDGKDFSDISSKTSYLRNQINNLPLIFAGIEESLNSLSSESIKSLKGFETNKLTIYFEKMSEVMARGIIEPIQNAFPEVDELLEVDKKLNVIVSIIDKIANTINMAGRAMLGIKPFDLSSLVSMKEGVQKISDPKVFEERIQKTSDPKVVEAEIQQSIKGKSTSAINVAERLATARAKLALSEKTGMDMDSMSGVEVETQVDMEKSIVKAVAKWSKEKSDAALSFKKAMREMNPSAGGPGRSVMPTEPAQAVTSAATSSPTIKQVNKLEPAQVVTSAATSSPTIKQVNKPEPAQEAVNSATTARKQGGGYAVKSSMKFSTGGIEIPPIQPSNLNKPEPAQAVTSSGDFGSAMGGMSVPQFAEGGVVNKATLGVVGEAGPEAIVPLSGIEKYSSGIISGLEAINFTLKLMSATIKSTTEKYSSNIMTGLEDVSSNLTKLMSATIKGGKKKTLIASGISTEDAGDSVISPIVDISKNALSFSLGMAMAPAVNNMSKSFKDIAGKIVSQISGISSKLQVSIIQGSSSVFDYIGVVAEGAFSLMYPFLDSISSYAKYSFETIKNSIPQPVKDYANQAFISMSGYFSSAFAPLTKGFTRSMNAGEGIFKSLSRGIQSQYMSITKGKPITEIASNAFGYFKDKAGSAFSSMSGYFSSAFAPLTKGFTRSMNAGEGIFKSLSRGIQSQYMSMTKGKPITEIASNAFGYVKENASKAFSFISNKIPQPVKDYANKAFSFISSNASKAFGFISNHASKAFSFISRNASKAFSFIGSKIPQPIKDYASKAFGKMSGYFSSAFAPLTKGFTKSMNAGEGIFKSLSRGIQSQYMSITKGKPITEIASNAFSVVKDNASKAFSFIGSKIPQPVKDYANKAFGFISSNASKAFGKMSGYFSSALAPLTKGFTKSMNAGEGMFKSLSRGIQSQYMSITKGKPITEIASNAFSFVKDNASKAFNKMSAAAGPVWEKLKTYGSQAFNKLSSSFASLTKGAPVSEIAKKAFSKVKEFGKSGVSGAAGLLSKGASGAKDKLKSGASKVGKVLKTDVKDLFKRKDQPSGMPATGAMSPVENVKKVGDAGASVKGNFEGVKEALKNLAEGIKSFANKDTFLGALNLIPTGIGLTAMVPGFLGAKLTEKINGEKIKESFTGLSEGLGSMANGKVLLGAGALLLSSIAMLALLPALPGLAILGAISGLVTSGFTALSSGLTTFGTAAANPMMWMGILALGALGVALIPLGYALSTISPLIVTFGTAVGAVLAGVGGIITSVAEGMTNFLGAVSLEKAAGLMGIATGLLVLSGAIVAFSVATAAAGWISFFGGDSKTLDSITKLADAGPNLNLFAQALSTITTELANFEASLQNIDSIEEQLNRLIGVSLQLGAAAPALKMASSLLGSPVSSAENSVPVKELSGTKTKSQFTDEWSEKYHPSPDSVKNKVQQSSNNSFDLPRNVKNISNISDEGVNKKLESVQTKGPSSFLETFIGGDWTGKAAAKDTIAGFDTSGMLGSASSGIGDMSIPGLTSGMLEGVVPDVTSNVESKPTVNSVGIGAGSKKNVEQMLMKERVGTEPQKSEVMSPELTNLTTETEEQTGILTELRDLFEQFLKLASQSSTTSAPSETDVPNTNSKKVVGKPTNYYRRVNGNMAQHPGRASVNLGAKSIS